jgi:AcrR family transcriptional regulator
MEPAAGANTRLTVWRAIRAAAVALVAERGFTAVTVDDIATAAGISRRTFFNYFSTKAAALFDPDPALAEHLDALLATFPDPEDPWAALRSICRAFVVEDFEQALPVRRRLVAEHPELADYHTAVHRHVERAFQSWAGTRCPDDALQAQLLARSATAVLTAAFLAWTPELGASGLTALVERAFDRVTVRPADEWVSRQPAT